LRTSIGVAEVPAGVLLARVLAAAGVHAVYGPAPPGLRPVRVHPGVAGVFAAAHRAVRGSAAAAWDRHGTLVVEGRTGDSPRALTADDPRQLPDLVAALGGGAGDSGVRLRMAIDLDAPAPDVYPEVPAPAMDTERVDELVARLKKVGRVDGGSDVVLLVGPGVTGAVGGLHALADAGALGVINTWGAKGVFDWRSRHHWATVGLQARDFELAGVPTAGLVVAAGVDAREAPPDRWSAGPHLVVDPAVLGAVAARWRPADRPLDMPPLRTCLAAVTEQGWAITAAPLAPSRVTLHYGQRLGRTGLVAADAGVAGYWVARTFATPRLGAALVPAASTPGWAAACVTVARLTHPLLPALAVMDGPPDETTAAVLDAAARFGVRVGVEAWGSDGDELDAEAHRARLDALVDPGGGGVATLATDPSQMVKMVEAAGAVDAWGGAVSPPG
jgi:hypothetical protein